MGLFDKLFGTRSEREIKKFSKQVDDILALEETYKALSDEQLRGKTQELKDRLAAVGLPVMDIWELKEKTEIITGKPKALTKGDRVVAEVIGRNGLLQDSIFNVI